MGRPVRGYEYSHQFRSGDEIKPLYPIEVCTFPEGFLFEIRTKFILKTRKKNMKRKNKKLVGSERFAVSFTHNQADYKSLQRELNFRLKPDYWMLDHEIQSFARKAFDFATSRPRAESSSSSSPSPTAVIVDLNVCTVQRAGETAREVASRGDPAQAFDSDLRVAVRSQGVKFDESGYLSRKSLFWELPRVRLEDDSQTGGSCPVCSRDFAVGDQVYNSLVPGGCCQHACHSRCVFELFRKRRFECPSCHVHVPSDMERRENVRRSPHRPKNELV